jgi:ActR/RegA family two-component response regulator
LRILFVLSLTIVVLGTFFAWRARESTDRAETIGARSRRAVAAADCDPRHRHAEAQWLRVARKIREADWGRRMRIVAVTGWGQEGDRRRAFAAGYEAHLTKPVDADELKGLLGLRSRGDIASDSGE